MTVDKNGAKKALYRFDKNYPLKEKLLPGSRIPNRKKDLIILLIRYLRKYKREAVRPKQGPQYLDVRVK